MLTKDEILAMKPGRELDALVTEKVMGLNIKLKGCVEGEAIDQCLFDWDPDVPCPCSYMEKHKTNIGCEHYQPVFKRYSTDISAAWEVAEKFHSYIENAGYGEKKYHVILNEFNNNGNVYQFEAFGETAPLAICRAALLAMEERT